MNLHDIIEAATPGPWRYIGSGEWEHTMCDSEQPYPSEDPRLGVSSAIDAQYIATFDPTLTAAMLAVCEAAGEIREQFGSEYDPIAGRIDSALCALESLLTERGLTMGGDE